MPRRVLVMTASVGAGHLRAAQAVELALRELDPAAEVVNSDILTLTNAVFRRLYGTAYLDLVNKMPHALGYFYDIMDKEPSPAQRTDRLRRLVQRLNLGKFLKLVRSEPWDVIVSTHFLPVELVAALKHRGELTAPQLTVTTDFETHRLWANEPCEHYFTATEEGAVYLHRWGVPSNATTVTGIPVHPQFARPKDRDQCRQKHGFSGDRPIVLQLAGGFGVGPVEHILQAILQVRTPLQVLCVAGRNEELRARLQALTPPERHRLIILGFTDEIDELMSAADVVVSKPGGLTSSEILASGAALAIVNPIPGQESRNSDYLLENGAAIKANSLATLTYKLDRLLNQPECLRKLQARAKELGRPRAAFEVAERVLEFADRGRAVSVASSSV